MRPGTKIDRVTIRESRDLSVRAVASVGWLRFYTVRAREVERESPTDPALCPAVIPSYVCITELHETHQPIRGCLQGIVTKTERERKIDGRAKSRWREPKLFSGIYWAIMIVRSPFQRHYRWCALESHANRHRIAVEFISLTLFYKINITTICLINFIHFMKDILS